MATYNSKTVAIDTLITTTWYSLRDSIADQVFKVTPFWSKMFEKGRIKAKQPDGTHFEVPVRYAKQDQNIQWFGRGATFGMAEKESLTRMMYYIRNLGTNVVRYATDDWANRGKAKLFDMVEEMVENTRLSLVDALDSALLLDESATDANAMNGLDKIIDTTPATGTVGTMNRASHGWMANQVIDFTGLTTAANLLDSMTQMLNLCSLYKGYGRPDLILMERTVYQDFERIARALQTIETSKSIQASLGFGDLMFKGIDVMWVDSPGWADNRIYFINTKTLELNYDPAVWMDMTDWKPVAGNSLDRNAQIISRCNLVCNSFQPNGVIHAITTVTS